MYESKFASISRRPLKPTIITSVGATSLTSVKDYVQNALQIGADLVEWRLDALGLDYFVPDRQEKLAQIVQAVSDLPSQKLLCCWRGVRDAGGVSISDADYLQLLLTLAKHCAYLDVEYTFVKELFYQNCGAIAALQAQRSQLVYSAHFFTSMPVAAQVDELFRDMTAMGAEVAKVAVTPSTLEDVILFREVLDRVSKIVDIPLIGIAMGPIGQELRINGHEYGSAATFTCVGEPLAPGQLSLETVTEYFN